MLIHTSFVTFLDTMFFLAMATYGPSSSLTWWLQGVCSYHVVSYLATTMHLPFEIWDGLYMFTPSIDGDFGDGL